MRNDAELEKFIYFLLFIWNYNLSVFSGIFLDFRIHLFCLRISISCLYLLYRPLAINLCDLALGAPDADNPTYFDRYLYGLYY